MDDKIEAWANDIIREVAELPDRNSPEGQPEMMLVSADELRSIIVRTTPEGYRLVPVDDQVPNGCMFAVTKGTTRICQPPKSAFRGGKLPEGFVLVPVTREVDAGDSLQDLFGDLAEFKPDSAIDCKSFSPGDNDEASPTEGLRQESGDMSDVMLCGVLRMPLEMQLADAAFGPPQLQQRMLEAADELEKRAARIAELERENEALKSKVGFYESVSPQDIVDEANRPEPIAIKEQSNVPR